MRFLEKYPIKAPAKHKHTTFYVSMMIVQQWHKWLGPQWQENLLLQPELDVKQKLDELAQMF